MIKVKIGDSEKELHDAIPRWINDQINRRRGGEPQLLCVHLVCRLISAIQPQGSTIMRVGGD